MTTAALPDVETETPEEEEEEEEEEYESINSSPFEISNVEIEESQALNRLLVEGLDKDEIEGMTKVPEVDVQQHQEQQQHQAQQQQPNNSYESLIASSTPLPHYTLPSLLAQIPNYSNTYTILLYDPSTDEFYALYSKKHPWASSNEKMIKALSSLTYLIRRVYPEKLKSELAIGISSGDYPAVKITDCVRVKSGVATGHERRLGQAKVENNGVGCGGENAPPILHFGSTFRHLVFPNMIS